MRSALNCISLAYCSLVGISISFCEPSSLEVPVPLSVMLVQLTDPHTQCNMHRCIRAMQSSRTPGSEDSKRAQTIAPCGRVLGKWSLLLFFNWQKMNLVGSVQWSKIVQFRSCQPMQNHFSSIFWEKKLKRWQTWNVPKWKKEVSANFPLKKKTEKKRKEIILV